MLSTTKFTSSGNLRRAVIARRARAPYFYGVTFRMSGLKPAAERLLEIRQSHGDHGSSHLVAVGPAFVGNFDFKMSVEFSG
jgi:hypothetical protein